ncbi:MAG: hypothetical protein RLZZ455_208 [Candidatus Parcubacteria bacterium]
MSLRDEVEAIYYQFVKHYFVYLAMNESNSVIDVGFTNDLVRRIHENKEKLLKGFTAKYHINKLVYFEIFDDVNEAISREKKMKGGSRKKKIALIEENNPLYQDLSGNII